MKRGLRAQIGAFIEEFPFITRYVGNIDWIEEKPTIKRVDLDLIDKVGYSLGYINTYSGFSSCYFLIDSSGTELKQIRQHKHSVSKGWWRKGSEAIPGETIAEAINEIDDPDKIRFVLEIYDKYRRDYFNGKSSSSYEKVGGVKITIYKVPSGRTFGQWMKEIPLVAKEQLQKELADVDNV